jgi:hypothetical protein
MVWIPNVGKMLIYINNKRPHTRRIRLFFYKTGVITFLSDLFLEYQYPESVVIRR